MYNCLDDSDDENPKPVVEKKKEVNGKVGKDVKKESPPAVAKPADKPVEPKPEIKKSAKANSSTLTKGDVEDMQMNFGKSENTKRPSGRDGGGGRDKNIKKDRSKDDKRPPKTSGKGTKNPDKDTEATPAEVVEAEEGTGAWGDEAITNTWGGGDGPATVDAPVVPPEPEVITFTLAEHREKEAEKRAALHAPVQIRAADADGLAMKGADEEPLDEYNGKVKGGKTKSQRASSKQIATDVAFKAPDAPKERRERDNGDYGGNRRGGGGRRGGGANVDVSCSTSFPSL